MCGLRKKRQKRRRSLSLPDVVVRFILNVRQFVNSSIASLNSIFVNQKVHSMLIKVDLLVTFCRLIN